MRIVIYLDPATIQNHYHHYHVWDGKQILEFHIQYEVLIAVEWVAVVRYDTAHEHPHRDILHPKKAETKEWFSGYANGDVLTIGQRDIMENWPAYA